MHDYRNDSGIHDRPLPLIFPFFEGPYILSSLTWTRAIAFSPSSKKKRSFEHASDTR